MKQSSVLFCLTSIILFVLLAAPVTADSPTITSISPAVGYLGSTQTVTVTGTNFNASTVQLKLMMSGESNITATLTSHDETTIVGKFTISSSREVGSWTVVVVNEDGSEGTLVDGFSLRSAITLTSITPTHARANNDSVSFTLVGTGLSDIESVYLYNSDYSNITASDISVDSSTQITGVFDLTDAEVATYRVYVLDSAGTRKYDSDVTFGITSDAVGSIDIDSSPSGASVYLDTTYMGITPLTVNDQETGTHKLILKYSGYTDYTRTVKVTTGGTTTVDASLEAITTAPTPTPSPIPVPTTAPTPVRTTRTSTITVPTSWASATTVPSTQSSPLEGAAIIGAIGMGILAVHRRR